MKLLLKNIKILSVLILAISFLGCEEDDEGNSLPEVVAGFTQTIIQDSGTVSFINISENAQNFEWDFGDGTSSTEIDPIKTYTSGTYTVTLTASNVAGASSTFEDELTITIPDPPTPLTLPIDFDGTNVDYDIIVGDNIGFTVETNPENGNGNDTNVGQMVTGGGQFQNVQFPLGPAVDFSGANKTIQLELFASTEIAVLIKFEDGADGARDVEVGATHTGSGWETLSFDFAADAVASFIEGDSQNGQPIVPDGQYGKLILFIGFNTNPGVEGTFFVDNIEQVGAGTGGGTCTAETEESISATDLNITWQTNTPAVTEDNVTFAWVDNPDFDGPVNTSCKVGQVTRANNSPFDNLQIDLADKFDFNAVEGLRMKVWSPVPNTPILLKLEEIGNSGNFVEVTATTSVTSDWEELTFDFPSTPTPQFDKMVIFFNFNVADGSTYYFDDLMVYGTPGGGGTCTPETEESIAAADLNITWQTNTPAVIEDNASFTWIDNPDFDGPVNTSCKVGQVVRANNSPFDNIQIDLADKLDFNSVEGLKMKVWSPVPNTPILLKLEEIGNSGNFVEVTATTSVTSDWEELTFDFPSTPTPQFDKMVIFFNFNVADGSTYYFDDLMVYGTPSGGACVPETGESTAAADLNITWQTNTPAVIEDNASFTWIDNPDFDGPVNTSCKVGQVVRANNSPFDNIQIDLAAKLDFNAVEGLRMKVWSPVPNTPVLLKLEEIGNSGNFAEVLATTSVTNDWEELTFDFDATPTPQFDKMVIFFNFNVADGSTYYFDDLMVYGTPVSGPTPLSSLPADFEGGEEFSAVFEPASVNGAITSNTVSGGINTSANIYTFNKPSGTEFYGGMENVFATPLDLTTTRTFKVKVYSTKPNVVFRFELQTRPDGPNFSIDQSVTNANEWVELTFDFNAVTSGDPGFNPNIYNAIVIIPDFDPGNDPTSTTETYYIDDVILE